MVENEISNMNEEEIIFVTFYYGRDINSKIKCKKLPPLPEIAQFVCCVVYCPTSPEANCSIMCLCLQLRKDVSCSFISPSIPCKWKLSCAEIYFLLPARNYKAQADLAIKIETYIK